MLLSTQEKEHNYRTGLVSKCNFAASKLGLSWQVVPEPVEKWQNIHDASGGEPSNLLEAFYKNPERYAYTFQNYVFVTRLMQVRKPISSAFFVQAECLAASHAAPQRYVQTAVAVGFAIDSAVCMHAQTCCL